ncbi:unnamed protein product [Amoebophrya sp. A25]|nr:unnamed protein product [Amoebophrya sp. A25]|eukprot:GSA25T00007677001.1
MAAASTFWPARGAVSSSVPTYSRLRVPKTVEKLGERVARCLRSVHKLDHALRYRSPISSAIVGVDPRGPAQAYLRGAEQAALIAGLETADKPRKKYEQLAIAHLLSALQSATSGGLQSEESMKTSSTQVGARSLLITGTRTSLEPKKSAIDVTVTRLFNTCLYLLSQPNSTAYQEVAASVLLEIARSGKCRIDFATKSEWELRASQDAYSMALDLLKSTGNMTLAEQVFREATYRLDGSLCSQEETQDEEPAHVVPARRIEDTTGATEYDADGVPVNASAVDCAAGTGPKKTLVMHDRSQRVVAIRDDTGYYVNWTNIHHTPAISVGPPGYLEEKPFWDDDPRLEKQLAVMRMLQPFIKQELEHFLQTRALGAGWAMDVPIKQHEITTDLATQRRSTSGLVSSGQVEKISIMDQKYLRPAILKAIPACSELLRQMDPFHLKLPFSHGNSEEAALVKLAPGTRFPRWQSQGSNLTVTMAVGIKSDIAEPIYLELGGHSAEKRRHLDEGKTVAFAAGWDHRFGTPEVSQEDISFGSSNTTTSSGSGITTTSTTTNMTVAPENDSDVDPLCSEPGNWMLFVSVLHPQLVEEQHLFASMGRRTEWEFFSSRTAYAFAKLKAEHEYKRDHPDAAPLEERHKNAGGFSRKHIPTRFNIHKKEGEPW